MARMNVYLPDELAESAKASNLNVSRLTQEALRTALRAENTDSWLATTADLEPTGVTHDEALEAVAGAKSDLENAGDG